MIIIKNHILPFGKKYFAINLFGIIFAKGDCSGRTLRHEAIHSAQLHDYLYIGFYILYIAEWIVNIIRLRDSFAAYHAISFEREAYAHENETDYLSRRKRFADRNYKIRPQGKDL